MNKKNKKAEENKFFLKNKKADIPVMVLVVGVVALFGIALLSFYVYVEKPSQGGVESVFYLQDVYNTAESARYSISKLGGDSSWYQGVQGSGGNFVVYKEYKSKKGEPIMRVTYNYNYNSNP